MRMELAKGVSADIHKNLGLQRRVSSIVQKVTTSETSYRNVAVEV